MVKKFLSSSQKLKFLPFDIYLVFSEPHTTTSDKGDSSLIDCFYMYVKPSSESANYKKDNYCFVKSRWRSCEMLHVCQLSCMMWRILRRCEADNSMSHPRAGRQIKAANLHRTPSSPQGNVFTRAFLRGALQDAFHSRCAPKLYCNAFMAQGSPQGNVFTRTLPL